MLFVLWMCVYTIYTAPTTTSRAQRIWCHIQHLFHTLQQTKLKKESLKLFFLSPRAILIYTRICLYVCECAPFVFPFAEVLHCLRLYKQDGYLRFIYCTRILKRCETKVYPGYNNGRKSYIVSKTERFSIDRSLKNLEFCPHQKAH